MKPSSRDLYDGLGEHPRLRKRDRKQLLILHEQRNRPVWMQWIIDGGIMMILYAAGYSGAYAYWWMLETTWDAGFAQIMMPMGHAIPALVAGAYTGKLFYSGRYFFVFGPIVLFSVTLYRELIVPYGVLDSVDKPLWLIWALCLEGMLFGGIAMGIGAWAGYRSS